MRRPQRLREIGAAGTASAAGCRSPFGIRLGSNVEELDREAAADRLNDIASALRDGDEISVCAGNKNVRLAPTERINYRIDVIEKRSRFRGSRETIRIELDWKPE